MIDREQSGRSICTCIGRHASSKGALQPLAACHRARLAPSPRCWTPLNRAERSAPPGRPHRGIRCWQRLHHPPLTRVAVLSSESDPAERLDRLCELTVLEQAHNVCRTKLLQDAWKRGNSWRSASGFIDYQMVCCRIWAIQSPRLHRPRVNSRPPSKVLRTYRSCGARLILH